MGISPPDDVLKAAHAPKDKPTFDDIAMEMVKPRPEIKFIVLHETVRQSWMRDASTFALVLALIGTGVFLDSSAMQWLGFLILLLIGYSRHSANNRLSFEEARAYIDKLEKELKG